MIRRAIAILVTLVVVAACASSTPTSLPTSSLATSSRAPGRGSSPPQTQSVPATSSTPSPIVPPAPVNVDGLLGQMSTDQKIGQLFMVSFFGATATTDDQQQVTSNQQVIGADNIADAIAKYHLGGVIYFQWAANLQSAIQIANLSNSIQTIAARQSLGIPLFISTDQEGGSVVRLPPPATVFPGNMALGATDQTDLSRATGKAIGQEAAVLGINQVLAPVGDVNVDPANPVIGLRSFGSDATAVASMTAAMVQGFQDDAGVGAAVKHFPGHGDTNIDSHTQLPIINHTAAQWASIDQPPFTAAIQAGVDMVMVGHLAVPALDPTNTPASLSPAIVTDELRNQMGFDGVVITDSLVMGALTNTYGDDRVPVLGLQAGDDILLLPPSLPVAFDAVKAAVQSGVISQARLDASARRILALKVKLGLFGAQPVSVPAAAAGLGTQEHKSVEQQDAEASVTLLANGGGLLPLDAKKTGSVLVVGPTGDPVTALAGLLSGRGLAASTDVTGTDPNAAAVASAAVQAANVDTIIDLTIDADTDGGQQHVEKALAATGKPLITASIGRPYDQGYYRAAVNLCLYSESPASLSALVRVIFGDIAPAGHLPVAIPNGVNTSATLYPIGYGLGY